MTIFIFCYTDLLRFEWVECLALRRVYYLESEYFLERSEELDELKSNKDPEDPFQEIRPPFLPHPEMRETIPNVSLNSVLYQLPNQIKEYDNNKKGDDDGQSLLERQLDATVSFFDKCIPNQPGFTSSVVAVTIVPDAKRVAKAWMKWYDCGKKFRRLRYIKYMLEKRRQMQIDGILGIHDYVDTALKAPILVAKATGKATTHVAKATGNAMTQVTDRVCGTAVLAESGDQENDASMADPLTPIDYNVSAADKKQDDSSTEEKQKGHNPVEADGIVTKSFQLMQECAGNEDEERDGGNANDGIRGNWFGQIVTIFGPSKKDESKLSTDEETGVVVNVPKSSVYYDAQHDPSSPGQCATSPCGSELYVDSKLPETERSKSPRTKYAEEHFEYQTFDPDEFAQWIGFSEETECDEILDTLGVEQLTAYSREMSQSASNPCVYGCNDQVLALWSIDELEDKLEDAWEDVRQANAELLRVRAEIFRRENGIKSSKNDVLVENVPEKEAPEERDVDVKKLSSIREEDRSTGRMDQQSERGGLRHRGVPSAHKKYMMAQKLVNQMHNMSSSVVVKEKKNMGCCNKSNVVCFAEENSRKVANVLDHPSFAIVTLTSRQAAIAARQCLADGRGTDRWDHVDAIPVPPLADAPPRNIFFCRGCCRPVTLTINPKEQKARQVLVWTCYVFFCCLYTIPLALTSAVLSPDYLAAAFPDAAIWQNSDTAFYRLFAGISSGMLYSLFFSVLPQIFKYLAFMLGSASTVAKGEDNALQFYWYFMLVTAFTGSTLATMLLEGFKDALTTVAQTIPTSQAPVWLNWMITRTFITLPMNYLFQLMTFLYGCIKFKWLNRVMRGGG
jgi:hypothetical protein